MRPVIGMTCAIAAGALAFAPVAAAVPTCTQTGPRTTQCQTPGGSTQIVTSPPPNTANQWGGYGYGYGWGLSFGGISLGGVRGR